MNASMNMQTHTIRSGDTLGAIARKASTTLEEIKRLNPQILDINKISVGQVISLPDPIPASSNRPPAAPSSSSTSSIQHQAPKSIDGLQFKRGVSNFAKDINTIHVRKIIKDEFGGGTRGDALQCTEYVQFRVAQNGVTIRWPADRPRHGGRWADIFERNKMYRVLLEPKIGCAISFTSGFSGPAATFGHIAYVEEVFSDGSIRITEANWPGDGKYNDRVLQGKIWKDQHKCKFIDFS